MSRKFIVGILALLAFFFFIQTRMPRHYVWNPTFAHSDEQPFGCRLFDSVMAASMPGGYTVGRQTLWQLQHDSDFMARPHGVVILSTERANDAKTALRLANKGCVLLVTEDALSLSDTLGYSIAWNSSFNLMRISSSAHEYTTLRWAGPPGDSLTVDVLSDMLEWSLTPGDSTNCIPLITDTEDNIFAAAYPVGKGEIIVVAPSLLLTNYGMLHEEERLLTGRLMSRMHHLPVVRTEAYVRSTAQTEQSPFYVFLQRPPLRWALYLAMSAVLLFMLFTARRRQRVIPVVSPPRNGNLDFVEHVGTLFFQQGDHRGLVERKLSYTAEEVRRLTGVDILEDRLPPESWAQLSRLTGLTADELRLRIANAREATTGHHVVTAEEMKVHVDHMNEIMERLNK